MNKTKKIVTIAMVSLLSLSALAGIFTGIYFGVKTVACDGYVMESGTNTPLANVSVTDGKNVVKTDANGYYKIKGWHKAAFVTVTIPSGYWTENYYIRIDKSVKEYNFSLDKNVNDGKNHTFLQISDTEIGKGGVGDWIDDVKNVVVEQDPAFLIHTGDICYTDGLNEHIKGMNSENMGVPVRYTLGNHDYVDGKYGEALFEKNYGPTCYSFDVGDIHYVVTPIGYGDKKGKYSQNDIWRWLDNDLKNKDPDKKVVMFNHTYCPDENGFVVKYGNKKVDLRENGLIAWAFGHWHYNYVNDINGILNISTARPDAGGVDCSPNAVRSVSISGNAITDTQLHYYGFSDTTASENYIWQTKIKGRSLFGDPLIVGDKVYVGTSSDNFPSKSAITCLSLTNGEILWEYDTANSIRNTIAHKNGAIIVQDAEGRIYSINAETGVKLRMTETEIEGPRNTGKGVVIDGDYIYGGNDETIVCLAVADGSTVWSTKRDGNSSSPSRNIVHGDYLIVGCHWDRLVVLNKNSGKILWESKAKGIFITSTPVVYNNKIYLASDSKIYELNLSDGKQTKEVSFDGYSFDNASTPIIIDGIGYYATANSGIVAINMNTLEKVWGFSTKKALIYTSPYTSGNVQTVDGTIIERNGKLYFGASDGYIYIVDRASGALLSEFYHGVPVLNGLAFVGDNIIIADFGGNVSMWSDPTL